MGDAGAVATAFRYPRSNSSELLTDAVAVISDGATRQAMDKFATRIAMLSLGEWEELQRERASRLGGRSA